MAHQQRYSLNSFITQMTDKLTETIVALESDQVIEQMRNDKTLYKFKITHIKEIIQEHFNFAHGLAQLLSQNQILSQNLNAMQQKIAKKDQEFAEAIDLIEVSAKKHTLLKEQEISQLTTTIKDLEAKLSTKTDSTEKYSKKTNELSLFIHELEVGNEKLQKQVKKWKEQNQRLVQINKNYQTSLKQLQSDHEKSVNLLKSENQKQIQEYQSLLKKMQNDMLLIKGQWQKKCNQVQKGLKQFYENELAKLEEKKTRELIQHIETIKEGKPIIIKQDQQILNSRFEFIRRQHESQIQKIQNSKSQLKEICENLQNSQISKNKQIENLSEAFKNLKAQYETQKNYWLSEKEKTKREIQKLKAIALQFERNSKDASLSLQAKQSEIVKLQDKIKYIEKKLEIACRNVSEHESVIAAQGEELQMLKNKCICAEDACKKSNQNLESMEAEIQIKMKKIQTLSRQLEELKQRNLQLTQEESAFRSQIKGLKSAKIKYRKVIDRVGLQLKNFEKQLLLLKQDVKYTHELQRKRASADIEKIIYQVQVYKENVQKVTKTKMSDLINQIQEAKQVEQAQFENVLRERENLKRQVRELEELFLKKQLEVEQAKKTIMNAQVDAVKKSMLQELQKQKQRYDKLEAVLSHKENEYHRRLDRAKMELKDAIRVLTSKWMEEMGRLEEENKRKQIELHRVADKVQIVIEESEEIKRNYENQQQQLKRLRKKYESLKHQKEEQIADCLKRLQKQSKHKISLEKQLRSIRSELNRGGRYQEQRKQESQNRNIGNNSITDRQKELTQIRELIAKTYQAVGEKPEKDTKFHRERSPF